MLVAFPEIASADADSQCYSQAQLNKQLLMLNDASFKAQSVLPLTNRPRL